MQTLPLDTYIFKTLHATSCSGSLLDQVILFISNYSFFIWLAVLLVYVVLTRFRGLYPALICVASFLIAWVLTDEFLKPFFNRERPFLELGTCVYGHKPNNGSFPSGHMLTATAIATVFSLFNLKNKLLCFFAAFFAAFIGYTRIYLGVHFPTDILAGAFAGGLFGWSWFGLTEWGRRLYSNK